MGPQKIETGLCFRSNTLSFLMILYDSELRTRPLIVSHFSIMVSISIHIYYMYSVIINFRQRSVVTHHILKI